MAISSSPYLKAISQICCLKAISAYLCLKAMSSSPFQKKKKVASSYPYFKAISLSLFKIKAIFQSPFFKGI